MTSPVSQRTGITAIFISSRSSDAGHDAGGRSASKGGGGRGRAGWPCFWQVFKNGIKVPQWPPLKPVAVLTVSGA
eukprot:2689146-Rhodomonas_salina.3